MASLIEWKVPQAVQPRAEDFSYDLARALSSVVGLHSIVPSDAFTADTLGIERAGNGVLIDDGLVLTIGYLITEAETVWLHLSRWTCRAGPCRSASIRRPVSVWCRPSAKSIFRHLKSAPRKPPKSANASWSAGRGAGHGRSPGGSLQSRNSPGIGNMSSTKRFSPPPRIPNWGGTALISGRGQTDRHRLTAARARARRQERISQHDRTDRSVVAGA